MSDAAASDSIWRTIFQGQIALHIKICRAAALSARCLLKASARLRLRGGPSETERSWTDWPARELKSAATAFPSPRGRISDVIIITAVMSVCKQRRERPFSREISARRRIKEAPSAFHHASEFSSIIFLLYAAAMHFECARRM